MNTSTPTIDRHITEGQLDLDIDEMLDAAVPPPSCEWRDKGAEPCGDPATWIMSVSCGHSYYYDDEHGERMMRALGGHEKLGCDNPAAPTHRRPAFVTVRFDRIES